MASDLDGKISLKPRSARQESYNLRVARPEKSEIFSNAANFTLVSASLHSSRGVNSNWRLRCVVRRSCSNSSDAHALLRRRLTPPRAPASNQPIERAHLCSHSLRRVARAQLLLVVLETVSLNSPAQGLPARHES